MHYDVFNGDADGICALIQLRLANPVTSQLITGVKRDIALLDRISAAPGDIITVLDISLDKNKNSLDKLLEQGCKIFYVDHHQATEIPKHSALQTMIDTDANTCTSVLVDHYLQGRYRAWAVTAAFGDNLEQRAYELGQSLALSTTQIEQLKLLGTCTNYNGYGSSIEDLHFAPDELYQEMAPFKSPFDFIAQNPDTYNQLVTGYKDDLAKAEQTRFEYQTDSVAVLILPDETWTRRISGVYANDLANQNPRRAHAIISINKVGGYLVSVRAPLINKTGADELCASFPTGGGRKAAAGINHLPQEELPTFIKRFENTFQNTQNF